MPDLESTDATARVHEDQRERNQFRSTGPAASRVHEERNMTSDALRLPWIWSLLVALQPADEGRKAPPAERPALLVRLVHPERQAGELLGRILRIASTTPGGGACGVEARRVTRANSASRSKR